MTRRRATTANDEDSNAELELVLQIAARIVVNDRDPAGFFAWFNKSFAALAPGLWATAPGDAAGQRSFRHILGRAIWDRVPRPDNQFRPQPLPKPERNQACPCGSGVKFKHCCQPMAPLAAALDGISLLRYVLELYPAKELKALPFAHLNPEEVAHVAGEWFNAGDAKRAEALLAPLLADFSTLDARHAAAFWLLLDCYDALGNPRKKQKAIEAALGAPNRQLAADAAQRLATMLSDRGDYAGAWRMFAEAQRLNPDDTALANLEILLLVSQGEKARAAERAKFWIARLSRQGSEHTELISFLHSATADAEGAMFDFAAADTPAFARLKQLLDSLPAVATHYRLDTEVAANDGSSANAANAGPLRPDQALAGLQAQWRQRVAQDKPNLTFMDAESAIDWPRADGVLSWLERQPLAWSCFDVLDDLVLSLRNALQVFPGAGEKLVLPLLARAERVLREVIAANRAEGLKLEWSWMENRPALRLIAGLAYAHDDADRVQEAVRVREWMVLALNPNDNHGLRDSLSRQYLELGRVDDALRLAERYPDDMGPMQYNRVLALFMAGRQAEAAVALAGAKQDFPEVFRMLVHANPRQPTLHAERISVGGKDEAWYYREDHLALWQKSGALEWARAGKGRK